MELSALMPFRCRLRHPLAKLLLVLEGRGAPVVEVGTYLGPVPVAHGLEHAAGRSACENGMGAKQGQGKAKLVRERGKAGKGGNVCDARVPSPVEACEKAFLLHVHGDKDVQGIGK